MPITKMRNKTLSMLGLLNAVRGCFEQIPDPNSSTSIPLADRLMSSLAVFGFKFPSLLQFDQHRQVEPIRSNLRNLYGVAQAPCDTYLRQRLDAVDPALLRPAFKQLFSLLQRGKGLEGFTYLDDHYLLSIDGTGQHASSRVHCRHCCQKQHRSPFVIAGPTQEAKTMPQLGILSESERRAFANPPKLDQDARPVLFSLTPEYRRLLSRMQSPVSRIGFVLQLGYFRANAQFFNPALYRKHDVAFVCKLLGMPMQSVEAYEGTVPLRHRRRIRSTLGWTKIDATKRLDLLVHAQRYAENQEQPRQIFAGLIERCWQNQWEIPAYTELSALITEAFLKTEVAVMKRLSSAMNPVTASLLDEVLAGPPLPGHTSRITNLKQSDHSLRPGRIRQSLTQLVIFRDLFQSLHPVIVELSLSDKATEYYATWLSKADYQQLSQFEERQSTYVHVLAFIKHEYYRRQDFAIDVLLKSVASISNLANKQLNEARLARHEQQQKLFKALRVSQLSATQFASGVVAVTRSLADSPNEKYRKIELLVEDYLSIAEPDKEDPFVALDRQLSRETKGTEYYNLLATLARRLQLRVGGIIKHIEFDEIHSDSGLIEAIEYYKSVNGAVDYGAPTTFLTPHEYPHVIGENHFYNALYKALLFIHIGQGIKSGDLNLRYSYRFRSIHDYLIGPQEWAANKETLLQETGLEQHADVEALLSTMRFRLDEQYRKTNERYLQGQNPFMNRGQDDRYRVRTPKTDYDTHSFVASSLEGQGIVPILGLLHAIDGATGFTDEFTHFSTKRSKMRPSKEALFAGIIAQGCNIGIGKLAKISTGINEDQLRNTVTWFFDDENLRAANNRVVSLINELALANSYLHQPPTIHSSSDGRKMSVDVDCLHANYSFKYFGKDKGVTEYLFVDERHALFHTQVFSASDREAPYVIDGLMDNNVEQGRVHSTDTHGFTEQIFGVSHLLNVAFAPRLAGLHKHRLYGFSARKTYLDRDYALVPSRTINQKLIIDQWDDILRFVATIRTRRARASQLFKRLSSYSMDHPLYRALKEFGRITKSQFILTYYDDLDLRSQVQKQLNRVELANKFSRAVFFDNDQAFQVGAIEHQESALRCKLLLQNSIVLWNYLTLSEKLIAESNIAERSRMAQSIRNGSILTWSHVNLRGQYSFEAAEQDSGAAFDIAAIKALHIG